jgi:ParB-like chromosome segregation protein Spo0J
MNSLVIMSLAYMYRTGEGHAPPILVRKEGAHYRILDGRHRFMASLIAGRRRVLAVVEE